MSEQSLLMVRSLTAGYGSIVVLENVDLEVDEGEVVAVLGANGAGKSTLIRAITGFADVHSGGIYFRERELTGRAPFEIAGAGIAQVPDGRRLFGSLTVEENLQVAMYARRRELARSDRDRLVEDAYSLFPRLRDRRSQVSRTLSGGEQQMLAIARALVLEPRVLLLDEPSTGLAPVLVDTIFEAIDTLAHERELALILVEQSTEGALDLCDRGYVLQRGSVVRHGTAAELRARGDVRAAYMGAAPHKDDSSELTRSDPPTSG